MKTKLPAADSFKFTEGTVENPGPKDTALGSPKRTAQGSRYRPQGKNNKRKLIFSLSLAPYASCLKPLLAGKAIAL